MKKYIYLVFDTSLLLAAIIYKIFKFKKVDEEDWGPISSNKTVILANGPSLKTDIKKVIQERKNSEIYVLNYFASTEYFLQLKPEYYILADRVYWSQGINDEYKKENAAMYNILNKVDWKMTLVCPKRGFQFVSEQLRNNNNIKVLKVNSANIEFKNENISLFALNHNLTTPDFINGLVMMLWHAVYKKRLDIEIYGADFSLFTEYYVDQKTNVVYSTFSHFYKNTDAENNGADKYPGLARKMLHTRLYQQWSALYQMYLLSRLAKKNKIKVTNLSSHSFLDCFDRP
jgi:hypothetical protein